MEIQLDPVADALYLTLKRGRVAKSREVEPGVVLDLDRYGRVLGIEMLDASRRYATEALRRIDVRRVPSYGRGGARAHRTRQRTRA
ncbi:DUF2283 domain-containing protein [Candidatus Uhrbacteria bacterium]|nr:DUF2283 domain-containing protein [Candidatus Uhrbacteria bacterium]